MGKLRRKSNRKQIEAIQAERTRQDKLYPPVFKKAASHWLAILVEEVGEVAQELNNCESVVALRMEIVQVAATSLAWLEELDDNTRPV